jgi:prolyl oligopeptidase
MKPSYPFTRSGPETDTYHGTEVPDPFRWLEQSADTPEVREWIERQNATAHQFLDALPERTRLQERLTELWNYPKAGAPWERGGRYFQFRNTGLQDQDVLFTMDSPQAAGRLLLDPNELAADGTASLNSVSVSPDGRYLAYGVNRGGSDWITWQVRDVASGEDLPDQVPWSRFSLATWLPDSSGFLYKRYPTPEAGQEYVAELENARLFLHHLGTDPASDPLVYARPDDSRLSFHPVFSEDGQYLVLYITRGTEPRNLIHYRRLTGDEFSGEAGSGETGLEFQPLIAGFTAEYLFLGNDGERFYLQTDEGTERGRIVSLDLAGNSTLQPIIPESDDTLLDSFLLQDLLVTLYQRHASHRLIFWNLQGQDMREVTLPALGTVTLQRPKRSQERFFYSFTSFLQPGSIFEFQLGGARPALLWESRLPFDATPYETRQVFATSADGTRVPVFLVHRSDLQPAGDAPTLLYGYGGFNISLNPSFSVSRLAWLERGGVLAVANLRGGGEYGRSWHEAGTLERKQNVFNDFFAAAELLISEGITRPGRLAIQGGSNGGLLVGASITQRPDLFGAAHAAVGVLDMLRYHLFTIGWAWASDYGTSADAEQFRTLFDYSPLHNVRPGTCYPATLITTGDLDDRVVPAHSFKFAAALQQVQDCDRPVLLRVMTRTGHGHGKPTRLLIEEQADIWAFLLHELEVADG